MLKRTKRLLIALGLLAASAAIGYAIFWVANGPRNVGRLASYHDKYSYETLYEYTRANPPASDTFKIVVLGDTRNNLTVARKVYAAAAAEKAQLIFNTGDLIRHGSVDEFVANHLPLLKTTDPVPVFCVPGNHERGKRMDFAAFKAVYGGTRFSFDYGGCRFVGFNASEHIRVNGSDLRFLERELSKPGAARKFVFFHIPPKYFEREIASNDRRGFEWNANKLRKLLTRHGVNEVFMGHIHGYATKVIDGVRYTLTAGGGAPLSERLPQEASVHNYVVLTIGPDGIREEVVRLIDDKWVRAEVQTSQ